MTGPIAIVVFAYILVCSAHHISNANEDAIDKECADQLKVSMDDVIIRKTNGFDSNIPVSNAMMCFDKCVLEKFGIVGADGLVNITMAVHEYAGEQADAPEKITNALKKCKSLHEGQKTCSAVYNVMRCTFMELPKV